MSSFGVRSLRVAVTTTIAVLAPACTSASGATPAGLAVVATTTQTADFARVVGGDRARVYQLIRAGTDPHEYDPSPRDLREIATAKIIVMNGLGLEKWFADGIELSDTSARVVVASSGIAVLRNENGTDPHVWQNPRNAEQMVRNVAVAFIAVDPTHARDYTANADRYLGQLEALDGSLATSLAGLGHTAFVTDHDAFGYLVDRFHLNFVGSILPSFDSQTELSISRTKDLVKQIRATGVKAIFTETSLPAKISAAIAHDAGVRVVAGTGALYGDSLGPPGSDGDSYLKMMRHNVAVIVANLR